MPEEDCPSCNDHAPGTARSMQGEPVRGVEDVIAYVPNIPDNAPGSPWPTGEGARVELLSGIPDPGAEMTHAPETPQAHPAKDFPAMETTPPEPLPIHDNIVDATPQTTVEYLPRLGAPWFEPGNVLIQEGGEPQNGDAVRTHYEDDPRRIDEGPTRLSTINPLDLPFREDCREWAERYHLTYNGSAGFIAVVRIVTFRADSFAEFEDALSNEMARVRNGMENDGQAAVAEWQGKTQAELEAALEGDLRHKVHQTVGRLSRAEHGSFDPCRDTCGDGEYCDFVVSISNISWSGIRIDQDIYIPPSAVVARHAWRGPGNQVVHIYAWVSIRYRADFYARLACQCTEIKEVEQPSR